MKVTKRGLAARFVDALNTAPLDKLVTALLELATEAGYDRDDLIALVAAVQQELQTRFGIAEVELTTAHALPAEVLKSLAARVAAVAGLQLTNYTYQIDPELLGGFEARVGDVVMRESIRERLTHLEAARG